MQQAMATAAGVAGGVLAAGAIRDLLGGGGSSSAQASTSGKEGAPGSDATAQQASNADADKDKNVQNASDDQKDKDRQDDNYQDAHDDDSSGWDDGGDFEI